MISRFARTLAAVLPLAIPSVVACSSAPPSSGPGSATETPGGGASSGAATSGDPASGGATSPGSSGSPSGLGSSGSVGGSSGGAGSSGAGASSSGSGSSGSSGGASAPEDAGEPPPASACDPVTPVAGTTDVPVTFEFNTGTTTPPTETGGPIDGSWTVTKATLYLPSGLQGLVNLQKSTGTVNAWGIFTSGTFAIDANVNISVSSVLGSQPLQQDYDYQGTDTTSGATFTIDATCGDAGPPPFTATYSSNGTTGTIDLAIQVQGGTADMVLGATIAP